jgi:hypothetical protein
MGKSLAKLRTFLVAEAKRNRSGSGIQSTEPVPMKIIKPLRSMRSFAVLPEGAW